MPTAKYQAPRPPLTAEVRRAVAVESGHACAITRCGEHTYLELHHINGNREDNRVQNLVLLCDKHHKMAHAGVIDQKAIREYKRLLRAHYKSALLERLERLEALVAQAPKSEPEGVYQAPAKEDPELTSKVVASRPQLMGLTLEQLALAKFERETGLLLERMPRFVKRNAHLQLDAVRQDDDLPEDLIVEVRWLRKRYLDAPIWVRQVDAAREAYELITGRKARGVLVFVVPKDSMKNLSELPFTSGELANVERKPEIRIYTYAELGFDPGAVTAGVFASNLRSPDAAA
jgi:hypothetical protein